MTCKVIQASLNHCRAAQSLLVDQTMAEEDCGLGILSEPYNVREGPKWAVSQDGLAAIVWRGVAGSPPMESHAKGRGFVAVLWGPTVILSVYLPTSLQRKAFVRGLEEGKVVRGLSPRPTIVAGDFNAKSGAWGSPRQDWRGARVLDWAEWRTTV